MQRRTLSEDSNLKQLVKLLLRTDNGEPEALSDNLVSANFRYKSYPFDHLKRFKAIGPTQQAIVALSLIKEAIFDGLLAKKKYAFSTLHSMRRASEVYNWSQRCQKAALWLALFIERSTRKVVAQHRRYRCLNKRLLYLTSKIDLRSSWTNENFVEKSINPNHRQVSSMYLDLSLPLNRVLSDFSRSPCPIHILVGLRYHP